MPTSKRRRAKPSLAEKEASARAINAQPWLPPPGMIKLKCHRCDYYFAAPRLAMAICPDCDALGTGPTPSVG